ncbi:MAG: hypothetical protein MPW15_23080 [Candidatus Manganitrophus sp.]|nr:hypothetical protein [Candidatus Manganitrophus sp.]
MKGMVERVKEKFGMERSAETEGTPAAASQPTPVSTRFQSFHDFVTSADPKKEPPVTRLIAELRRAYDVLQPLAESGDAAGAKALVQGMASGQSNDLFVAQRNAERLLQTSDAEVRRVVAPIFLEPFKMASSGLVSGAMADLNRRWRGRSTSRASRALRGGIPSRRGEKMRP